MTHPKQESGNVLLSLAIVVTVMATAALGVAVFGNCQSVDFAHSRIDAWSRDVRYRGDQCDLRDQSRKSLEHKLAAALKRIDALEGRPANECKCGKPVPVTSCQCKDVASKTELDKVRAGCTSCCDSVAKQVAGLSGRVGKCESECCGCKKPEVLPAPEPAKVEPVRPVEKPKPAAKSRVAPACQPRGRR